MDSPRLRTVLTPPEAIDALWHAHQDIFGGPCLKTLLETLAAHSAFETAKWHSMWGWNFGNLRGRGNAGSQMIAGADEIVDGKRVTGPAVESGFAAYSDRYEGARAYMRFLGTATHPGRPNSYQAAFDAASSGDVVTFCRELKAHGYFTANLEQYTKGMLADLEWIRSGPMREFLETFIPRPVLVQG